MKAEGNQDFGKPVSMLIDDRTGELFVCDILHNEIRVYK